MPEALERKLKSQAKKKGFSKKRAGAYIYGTMRKTGWKPSRELPEHAVKSAAKKAAMR